MPEIRPFRAMLYNSAKGKLDKVVAPPYDVISKDQQKALYDADPQNIVRLILNREKDPYAAAAETLEAWLGEQILVQDGQPAIYVVSQRYETPSGEPMERHGFIAACRIVEFGKGIYPHERTLSGPKADRLRLFQATHFMASQIFGIYADPEGALDEYLDLTIRTSEFAELKFEGVHNRAWRICDPAAIKTITGYIADQRVLIADGHHRYETAMAYRDQMRAKFPKYTGDEPFNFVPFYFTNMHSAGLTVLPTHRLIHSLPNFRPTQFLEAVEKYFYIDVQKNRKELLENLKNEKGGSFGVVLPGTPELILLRVKDSDKLHAGKEPDVVDTLDVSILHTIILERILGITQEQQLNKVHLNYEKEVDGALAAVKSGMAQAAFLLNPTPVESVRAASEAGQVMPQKSTYFYPKLLSGLVNYSFIDS